MYTGKISRYGTNIHIKDVQVHQPIRKLLCIQIVMFFLMFLFFSNINKALALEYTGFVQIDDEIKILTGADKLQLIGAISTKNLYLIDSGTLSVLKKVGFQNTLKNLAIDDDSKTLYVIHKESLTGTIYSIDLNSMAMSTCLEDIKNPVAIAVNSKNNLLAVLSNTDKKTVDV